MSCVSGPTTMRRASAAIWRRSLHKSISSTAATSPPVRITTLPNKIRVVTNTTPGHFSSVGLYVDAGARHETPHTSGASHFLDRMAFKVTTFLSFFTSLTHYKSITEHRESFWRSNGFSHRLSWRSNNVFFFSRIDDVPIISCT